MEVVIVVGKIMAVLLGMFVLTFLSIVSLAVYRVATGTDRISLAEQRRKGNGVNDTFSAEERIVAVLSRKGDKRVIDTKPRGWKFWKR